MIRSDIAQNLVICVYSTTLNCQEIFLKIIKCIWLISSIIYIHTYIYVETRKEFWTSDYPNLKLLNKKLHSFLKVGLKCIKDTYTIFYFRHGINAFKRIALGLGLVLVICSYYWEPLYYNNDTCYLKTRNKADIPPNLLYY